MTLPLKLQEVVERWLEEQGTGGARRAQSAALTDVYRAGGSSSQVDLSAYLVARLPATFAAVSRVLGELHRLRPQFEPESVLDVGSGPGTASWAAAGIWPDLRHIRFVDAVPGFLDLAASLARQGPEPLASAEVLLCDMGDLPAGQSADLVIAAYALAELPLARIPAVAERLWQASGRALVLLEPGTPQGFARIHAARTALLSAGAVPIAPCTHAGACPMTGPDWCHFSVRLARSRAHMHAKAARVPFEDERFSYLILTREGAPEVGARILAPPQHGKPGATFKLCTEVGLETRHIARRSRHAYREARKLGWGDVLRPSSEKDDAP